MSMWKNADHYVLDMIEAKMRLEKLTRAASTGSLKCPPCGHWLPTAFFSALCLPQNRCSARIEPLTCRPAIILINNRPGSRSGCSHRGSFPRVTTNMVHPPSPPTAKQSIGAFDSGILLDEK